MLNSNAVRSAVSGLMVTTLLTAPALADETSDRLDRLEAMLSKIMDRLDAHETMLSAQEIAVVDTARKIVAEEAEKQVAVAAAATERPTKDGFMMGNTNVSLKGYTKVDVVASRFSDGILPSNNVGRDFYIPALVTVNPDGSDMDDWVTDFSARETRFGLTTNTPFNGDKIKTYLEIDFLVTPGGDERISNSYEPRMRHAWIEYKGLRIGQDWSTFMDLMAFPDNLDFVGPAEGMIFERQPMVRYSAGPFDFAIEQPETAFTGPTGSRVISGSDPLPDFIARFTEKGSWGHIRLAGILRQLNDEDGLIEGVEEDSAIGYGLSLSGKFNVGEKDDLRFQTSFGEGLGRYVGLNVVNSAAIDANGNLDPIATYAGYASYRHFWSEKLRSNATFGYFKADNPVQFTGDGVTDEVFSFHGNLIYTLAPKFDIGIEYLFARRELENGLSGTLNRLQFSTKYAF